MLIVRNDVVRVESDLVVGLVACPSGDGFLRPWGHGRARVLRGEDRETAFRPSETRTCQLSSPRDRTLPRMARTRADLWPYYGRPSGGARWSRRKRCL